jgi:hypothetical protein
MPAGILPSRVRVRDGTALDDKIELPKIFIFHSGPAPFFSSPHAAPPLYRKVRKPLCLLNLKEQIMNSILLN